MALLKSVCLAGIFSLGHGTEKGPSSAVQWAGLSCVQRLDQVIIIITSRFKTAGAALLLARLLWFEMSNDFLARPHSFCMPMRAAECSAQL